MSRNDKESGLSSGRRNKSHIKCYDYYKMGHYANKCKTPKKKEEETHLTRADKPSRLLRGVEEQAQEWHHGAVFE
jgi:hypothetical protein